MNINGLRIVLEQVGTGPDAKYINVYSGKDGVAAEKALREPTPNWRMMFRPMQGTARNRPTIESAPVAEPVEVKTESPKSKKSK